MEDEPNAPFADPLYVFDLPGSEDTDEVVLWVGAGEGEGDPNSRRVDENNRDGSRRLDEN